MVALVFLLDDLDDPARHGVVQVTDHASQTGGPQTLAQHALGHVDHSLGGLFQVLQAFGARDRNGEAPQTGALIGHQIPGDECLAGP